LKHPFTNKEIEERYNQWPVALRGRLLDLRGMIFDVAKTTNGVGQIEETLKWQVPAYLTHHPKSGTTIRIDGNKRTGGYGLYVHCQTTLISTFRQIYPEIFAFEKNRAIIFKQDDKIAEDELRHCISMALTYHLRK